MRYSKLYMDDDRLRNSIELQVLARRNSKKITLPKNFIPRTQLDRFVWRNLVMDWPLEKLIKLYPTLSVNFVNRHLFNK
jgi:hypothetical protein